MIRLDCFSFRVLHARDRAGRPLFSRHLNNGSTGGCRYFLLAFDGEALFFLHPPTPPSVSPPI
jgi:hypothetical protein